MCIRETGLGTGTGTAAAATCHSTITRHGVVGIVDGTSDTTYTTYTVDGTSDTTYPNTVQLLPIEAFLLHESGAANHQRVLADVLHLIHRVRRSAALPFTLYHVLFVLLVVVHRYIRLFENLAHSQFTTGSARRCPGCTRPGKRARRTAHGPFSP